MNKGLRFELEFCGVKEDERWNDKKYIKPMQDFVDNCSDVFKVEIIQVAFYEDNNNLVLTGKIIEETKDLRNARFTIFKQEAKKVFKKFGLEEIKEKHIIYFDVNNK